MTPEITVTPAPTVGQECLVQVAGAEPVGGAPVRVVLRPGLPGQHEAAIGITDGAGQLRWTPDVQGALRLEAGQATAVVHVAPDGPPLALLGYGGTLALAIVWLMRPGAPRAR